MGWKKNFFGREIDFCTMILFFKIPGYKMVAKKLIK